MNTEVQERPTIGDDVRAATHVRFFDYAPAAQALWAPGPAGLEMRDLGLGNAALGDLTARQWRVARTGAALTGQSVTGRLAFLYVVAGQGVLRTADGQMHRLAKGSTANLPRGTAYDITDLSADFTLLEILWLKVPGGAGDRIVVTHEGPDAYVAGNGPRRFFSYRDLGTAEATGRAGHIQVVRVVDRPTDGTGWHYHSMGQFAMCLSGWAKVAFAGQGLMHFVPGDGLCICAGLLHDVPDFSLDYAVLEMCVPADYGTWATQPPVPAAA